MYNENQFLKKISTNLDSNPIFSQFYIELNSDKRIYILPNEKYFLKETPKLNIIDYLMHNIVLQMDDISNEIDPNQNNKIIFTQDIREKNPKLTSLFPKKEEVTIEIFSDKQALEKILKQTKKS